MALLSDEPGETISWLITGPFRNSLVFGDLVAAASRLTLAGLAASLAFRSGSFNLGGEGQALAGGLVAAGTAAAMPLLSPFLAVSSAMAAGVLAGAAVGSISGVLKARWDIDELISSFLIAAAAAPIGEALLGGMMKDPHSYLIAAPPLPVNYLLAKWLPPSRLGPVLFWAPAATAGVVIFLNFTRTGYEWRMRGANAAFARYGGIRVGRVAVLALSASGGLFGLAGTAALLDSGQAVGGFTGGLGWNGLAVALIAGNRPQWVPPAALAYAWLEAGTQAAMMHTGFSFGLSGVVQATIFLLVTVRIRSLRGES